MVHRVVEEVVLALEEVVWAPAVDLHLSNALESSHPKRTPYQNQNLQQKRSVRERERLCVNSPPPELLLALLLLFRLFALLNCRILKR